MAIVLSTSCHHVQHHGQQLVEDKTAGRVSGVSKSMGLALIGESTENLGHNDIDVWV